MKSYPHLIYEERCQIILPEIDEDNSNDYGSECNLQVSRTFKTEGKTYPFKE